MKRLSLVVAALVLASVSRDASAQGFINPFVGTTVTSPDPNGGKSKAGYGIAFGKIGKIVGGDTEVAYFPEILDSDVNALAKSRALTFSGDILIGPRIGPVKAYGALGVGDMYLNVTSLKSLVGVDPATKATNYFTINAGGGVMGFFSTHFGVRGDLRYFRAYSVDLTDLDLSNLQLSHFNFWRATVGLVATF